MRWHTESFSFLPTTWANYPVPSQIDSVSGALMYFATLTEVPILQEFIGAGTGKGPALSLLLAGPALSLVALTLCQ